MKKEEARFDYRQRIAAGLAASGGLICAACVSGLPAATCKALAQVYLDGLQAFGTAGFCGIIILGALSYPDTGTKLRRVTDKYFVHGFITLGFLSVLVGLLLSSLALPAAVDQCSR